ncbi:MAG: OmpH family outer membrane protein [Opitutaceae bacterium]|nr:OmpH family outer membrane protein [Opitutaceae bacterium]
MNNVLRLVFSLAVLGSSTLLMQAQPAPKILVVDMQKVFESHYKTEDNTAKLRADEQKAQVELERLSKEGQAIVDTYKELVEAVESTRSSPVASNDAKAKAEKAAQDKMQEIQKKQQEVQQFRANVERHLQQRLQLFQEQILEEISKIATEIARKKGATILVDKSGRTNFGISNFIYLDPAYEITDEVLKEVNKDRPAVTPKPAEAPAAAAPAPAASETPSVSFPGAKK